MMLARCSSSSLGDITGTSVCHEELFHPWDQRRVCEWDGSNNSNRTIDSNLPQHREQVTIYPMPLCCEGTQLWNRIQTELNDLCNGLSSFILNCLNLVCHPPALLSPMV
jgi:hypothetical protein